MSRGPTAVRPSGRTPKHDRERVRQRFLLGLCTAVCASATVWVFDVGADARGLALYGGRAALEARIQGHADTLPAEASRCVNCHAGETALGTPLDAAHLLRPMARRGGPPSRYDEAAFCRVLREGIDPAWVQLPREMPRYTVSDEDCRALWWHLSRA